jgi:hypothetical protein
MVIHGTIVMGNQKIQVVHGALESHGFNRVEDAFDYLTDMSLSSLTQERMLEMQRQLDQKHAQYRDLEGKTPEDLWLHDLEQLEPVLLELEKMKEDDIVVGATGRKAAVVGPPRKRPRKQIAEANLELCL